MTDEQKLREWNARAEWIQYGVSRGWCGDAYCATHDGGMEYWTEDEAQQWNDGGDPCQTVVRILGVD